MKCFEVEEERKQFGCYADLMQKEEKEEEQEKEKKDWEKKDWDPDRSHSTVHRLYRLLRRYTSCIHRLCSGNEKRTHVLHHPKCTCNSHLKDRVTMDQDSLGLGILVLELSGQVRQGPTQFKNRTKTS